MAGTYKRRQLLLRKENGAPGGFVRIERVGERCGVEFTASGLTGEARAVLVRPEEGGIQALGALSKQAAFTISAAEAEGCTQAAVVMGDAVLLVGGEGADFARIRRWLAQAARPPRREFREVSPRQEAIAGEAVVDAIQEAEAGAEPDPATEAAPEPEPAAEVPVKDGWEITPFHTPGVPEQIEGQYWQEGEAIATLYGIAGPYAPEPPPGLTGFTWDNGYWVYVRKKPSPT